MNLFAQRISLQTQQHSLKPSTTTTTTTTQLLTKNNSSMKDTDKCLDPQLWHACAGGMVHMPSVNSKVYYFPQGHSEHAQSQVHFGTNSLKIPSLILSRVLAVKFMADPETDEVFAKIRLVPVRPSELDLSEDEGVGLGCNGSGELQEKPASFAKTLTQSDANNGGGFSVPRYCAETIFPRLDYSADPPVQTVLAKDVHGEIWKFRHIYRGTPRRHLLTTGWSTFVNQKKLVAGDSIVFLRAENGDLCVGIRRAKRGGIGGCGSDQPCGWNPPPYGGFSVFLREEENKLMRNGNGNVGNIRGNGRVRAESVVEATTLAANGQPFEVVYYPRASTPEFCVKAAAVRASMRVRWCSGMRFKMAFETEDSSRISWFMGTISSVQVADPIRWPDSPWRLLQVSWDEPDLLQNVKRVSPWLVELVSNMPSIHLTPFSPPRKKLRISNHPDFPPESHQLPIPAPPFSNPFLGPSGSISASIQGARHAHFGISLPDLHLNQLQSGSFNPGYFHHRLNHHQPPIENEVSCLLTMGRPATNKSSFNMMKKTPHLVLFGQTILTEEQISLSSGNSSSDGNNDNGVENSPSLSKDQETIGHCKVFMESEDVGRILDLTVFGSYEELYGKLADMFGMGRSEIMGHLHYRDETGAVKHTGDAPFSEFMKTARRLTILMDSSGDTNVGV